jgi:hypothetical protein
MIEQLVKEKLRIPEIHGHKNGERYEDKQKMMEQLVKGKVNIPEIHTHKKMENYTRTHRR